MQTTNIRLEVDEKMVPDIVADIYLTNCVQDEPKQVSKVLLETQHEYLQELKYKEKRLLKFLKRKVPTYKTDAVNLLFLTHCRTLTLCANRSRLFETRITSACARFSTMGSCANTTCCSRILSRRLWRPNSARIRRELLQE